MRFLHVILFAAFASLSACSDGNVIADQLARDTAKGVVTPIVQQKFPGSNAVAISDCVIDAATAPEILKIATASVTGVTQDTINTVVAIAGRQSAVECIVKASLPNLILGA